MCTMDFKSVEWMGGVLYRSIVQKPLPRTGTAVIFISAGRVLSGTGKGKKSQEERNEREEKTSADVWGWPYICGGYHWTDRVRDRPEYLECDSSYSV